MTFVSQLFCVFQYLIFRAYLSNNENVFTLQFLLIWNTPIHTHTNTPTYARRKRGSKRKRERESLWWNTKEKNPLQFVYLLRLQGHFPVLQSLISTFAKIIFTQSIFIVDITSPRYESKYGIIKKNNFKLWLVQFLKKKCANLNFYD